jgi:hypothetical protein
MRTLFAVLSSTVWISVHEFLRNQWFLLDRWNAHYAALGMEFPGRPVNGAMWGLWALLFASALQVLSRRLSMLEASLVGWFFGFPLMWVVIGNLGVLPMDVLPYAVPWSVVEVVGAVWLSRRIAPARTA